MKCQSSRPVFFSVGRRGTRNQNADAFFGEKSKSANVKVIISSVKYA